MHIRDYINQLPEDTLCVKDPKLLAGHNELAAVFSEERHREYEEPAAVPALLIDPLF